MQLLPEIYNWQTINLNRLLHTQSGTIKLTKAPKSCRICLISYSNITDKADLVIEDFGYTAKGLASTVIGFKDGEIIVYRQGEIKLTP